MAGNIFKSWIVLIAAAGAGAVCLSVGIDEAKLFSASKRWTGTDAVIDEARIDQHRSRRSTSFTPEIAYHFSVNGVRYTGNRFSIPEKRSREESGARARLDGYAPGTKVKIYYDPADPTRSTALVGQFSYWQTYGMGAFGVGLLGLAVWIGWRIARGSRETPAIHTRPAPQG